eukprot:341909_1
MSFTKSCVALAGKAADYIDANFETLYLYYIQALSFITHHRHLFNSLPPQTLQALKLVLGLVLIVCGAYFSFFITLLAAYSFIQLFAGHRVHSLAQTFKQLLTQSDAKLRLDPEIVEWMLNQVYLEGIALYLSRTGIVRQFLSLVMAEFEGEMLWSFFEMMFVCFTSIYVVFWCTLVRNIMMSIFIYGLIHDPLFQSGLFHKKYYEKCQLLFHSSHVHWSKLLVEMRLFVGLYIYIVSIAWICGSFGAGMGVTFGSYLIVQNTVGIQENTYLIVQSLMRHTSPSDGCGDTKADGMRLFAWLFCVLLSLAFHYKN